MFLEDHSCVTPIKPQPVCATRSVTEGDDHWAGGGGVAQSQSTSPAYWALVQPQRCKEKANTLAYI